MQPILKAEIIVSAKAAEKVLALLQQNGLKGYSRFRNVDGVGDTFERDGDYPSDVFSNHMIVVGCTEEEFERVKEPLRKFLAKESGVCFVTPSHWLSH